MRGLAKISYSGNFSSKGTSRTDRTVLNSGRMCVVVSLVFVNLGLGEEGKQGERSGIQPSDRSSFFFVKEWSER